jgi:hypothetical protein
MTEMKQCECGAEFKRSRNDYTVRCPACREARRHKAPVVVDDYVARINRMIAAVAREDAEAGREMRTGPRGAEHPIYRAAYEAAATEAR